MRDLLGNSSAMQKVAGSIARLATTDRPVLVLGESGTGKELVARAIHTQSARGEKLFLVLRCAGLPVSRIDRALFGEDAGDGSAAEGVYRGWFEMAGDGTLFLHHVTDLPLGSLQAIGRALQEGQYLRTGGRTPVRFEGRIIAASTGDRAESLLAAWGAELITVPPLREHAEDIAMLACRFLTRFTADHRTRASRFSQEAFQALQAHTWPGNVRELQVRVDHAVRTAGGCEITSRDLGLSPSPALPNGEHRGPEAGPAGPSILGPVA
jgi:DNA-binding NtrC family response regulator